MTLAEKSYRTAIVALRDSRWEEATQHLLALFAQDPEYRDVGSVLIRLEQTRPIEYWCAAFDFAAARQDWADASAALKILAKIEPEYPHLAAMQQRLPVELDSAPVAEETSAETPARTLTERISAAMEQGPVAENGLKHWLEASALNDSAPMPLGASEESSDEAFELSDPADLEQLETAAGNGLDWLDSSPFDLPSGGDVIPSFDGILVDDRADAASPDDTVSSIDRLSESPAGEWADPSPLEQTQPRSITIHEADGKKKQGTSDVIMLILELLALFAIVVVVVMMAVRDGRDNISAIDRYGGPVTSSSDSFPANIPDLISAVDRQLVRISEPDIALERLHALSGSVDDLTGDDESAANLLSTWIKAGTAELEAAATMNATCAESGVHSDRCTTGVATHAASARDADAVREQVCDLLPCPP